MKENFEIVRTILFANARRIFSLPTVREIKPLAGARISCYRGAIMAKKEVEMNEDEMLDDAGSDSRVYELRFSY